MTARHLSLRLEADTFERLEMQSRQTGQSRSDLARTLLDEGLRMESHPGIIFRPGPGGRRPGLAGGPDAWEIVRIFQGLEQRGEEAVRRTAELAGLTASQVRTVLSYYAEYPGEINAWIKRVDEMAAQAEAAWRREQDILQR
ncbi:hypothetical protein [Nitrolancea hollandica]|uniref:Uncharacterized protein n=1 Tax=Nitrolancea hollandica Lb TaxID=1129897 RepID=I4ELM7_9BACT|nr:hypothetical protein [Nitrolancea hollandica]CCF85589.1 conserved hypothetical protein [Nitrolancea hollandica Lb]